MFPAIILHSPAPTLLRRKSYRRCVWTLVGILVALLFVLYKRAEARIVALVNVAVSNSDVQLDGQMVFDQLCIDTEVSSQIPSTVLAFFIATVAYGGFYFLSIVPHCQQRLDRSKDALNIMLALSATIVMWLALLNFYLPFETRWMNMLVRRIKLINGRLAR
ncbi:uncharacterized protein CC84DRAFT_1168788 [Paraphaeosphaeria sporulosa]|uniref:Uncharacterized protein n=1 Tax=Paraphaeosphaeria sporulosa TaxID=1460663 RepID=A0A177BZL1_9PLEO|nr:uncharacterized protein CC84DRAFT_1168788 [Paraphaeosphaeria sporulosa]OAF99876.1 hypothetical protein CC84DRAFT_1168788 [Paraphaeosphaeria sporulosa]